MPLAVVDGLEAVKVEVENGKAAIVAGVAAVAGEKTGDGIPKNIVTDGPVVTKANGEGMLWMESHYLI